MDDFPAGPASPGPARPPLSVVIPVRNGGPDFQRCLVRLRDSDWTQYELIVVDDGSTDGSAGSAALFGARVVRHDTPLGPAAARNAGVLAASAPIVFFLDADVALHPEALSRVMERFARDPDLAALFGSYDDRPAAPGLVSQFRNLLHHYIHQRGEFHDGARPVSTFWTGCGAIRRQVFLDLGGFDPRLYHRPAIEDIELGYRLTRAGHRIELVRDILATHLKRWTLRDIIRTDIFRRGVPWMLLILRGQIPESDLNVSASQRASVALTGLALCAMAGTLAMPWLIALAAMAIAGIVVLNRDFYRFLARRRGWVFAAASVPLHLIYFCCCGLSVLIALALSCLPSRRQALAPLAPMPHIPCLPVVAPGPRADAPCASVVPRPRVPRARRPSRWARP